MCDESVAFVPSGLFIGISREFSLIYDIVSSCCLPMTLAPEGERSEEVERLGSRESPPQIPRLQLSTLQGAANHDTTATALEKTLKPRCIRPEGPTSSRATSFSLPPVHASTVRERSDQKPEIQQPTGCQTARIRFAPPPRTTRSSSRPHRVLQSRTPPRHHEITTDLHRKQSETTRCFQTLERWQQTMQSGSLKIQLSDIHDALLAAVYYQRNETSSLSEMGDGNTQIEEKRQEYFTLVADAQQKLQLQRQERRKLETQLAMENALRRELCRQLDQLERELAQLHMSSGRNRAEIDCERAAVEQLELEYAALTSEEEDLQRDCEVLTLQLENQRAQLKELRGQQLYLDFVSSAPLKRHLEEKKWRGQHAAVLTQVQSAEAENRVIEEELKQLEDQAAGLEAQFGRDVQAKQQAETALSEARVRQQHIQEGFDQMRSCYTPRPDWDRIVDETPELSVQKYQWELAGSASDHQLGASIDDQTSQGEKTTKRCRSGVGGGCKDAGEEDAEGWRLPPSNGRTKLLVKEMMVWIERLQKHCGVNLHLSRIWHDIEEARVELNILHHQLDRAMRKSSTSAIPISEASGITAAAVAALNSPSKAKQDYILALGAHEGVPKFLRHRGKLKRQVLKKGEVDKVVRKVWVEKRKRERRNPLAKIPLEQVLYEKLHRKYGFQPLIAEWGYNLLLALQIFSWDTEIEMFLLCLTGAVSDRVYVDQEQMIESCHHLLLRLCELYRVESFVSERRVLLKDALVAMRKFFPLKTSGQLQAIEQAIIRDMHKMKRGGNDSILYIEDILPLDARYPVGFFVKTVRTQHFKEIQDYYATLLSELQQRDVNQTGTLPLSAIKEVIMAVDPLTETAAVYTLLMKAGGVKSRAQLDMLEIVNYKAALKQMNTMCLMKFALNFDPNAEINWRPRQTVDPIGGGKGSSSSGKRPANA